MNMNLMHAGIVNEKCRQMANHHRPGSRPSIRETRSRVCREDPWGNLPVPALDPEELGENELGFGARATHLRHRRSGMTVEVGGQSAG